MSRNRPARRITLFAMVFATVEGCAGPNSFPAAPLADRPPESPPVQVRVHLRSKALPRFERALLADYPCPHFEKSGNTAVDAPSTHIPPPTHHAGSAHGTKDGGGEFHESSHFGSGPADSVQKVPPPDFGPFRACYREGLERDPLLEGQVAVEFTIDKTGAVRDARAVCVSLPDPVVVACMVRVMTGISFPPPDGGLLTVRYPFVLLTTD